MLSGLYASVAKDEFLLLHFGLGIARHTTPTNLESVHLFCIYRGINSYSPAPPPPPPPPGPTSRVKVWEFGPNPDREKRGNMEIRRCFRVSQSTSDYYHLFRCEWFHRYNLKRGRRWYSKNGLWDTLSTCKFTKIGLCLFPRGCRPKTCFCRWCSEER